MCVQVVAAALIVSDHRKRDTLLPPLGLWLAFSGYCSYLSKVICRSCTGWVDQCKLGWTVQSGGSMVYVGVLRSQVFV